MLAWLWHWIEVHTGTVNESGPYYAWFSGFGSDLGEGTIFASIWMIYRQHKCKTCPRIAKHRVEGTSYKTCHKHSTKAHHEFLHRHHEERHPDQHEFLNDRG